MLQTGERFLGIDPGKNGSAVIVRSTPGEKPVLDFWAYWKPVTGGYSVVSSCTEFATPDLSYLSEFFGLVSRAAVEALFVGPARQAIVGTAETAGALLGAATKAVGGDLAAILRPPASRWRSDLLRLPGGTKAGIADKYAKKVIQSLFGESEAWRSGHAVDAACIALWCANIRGKPRQ